MRVLVLWCPDWSVIAALEDAGRPASTPAAVVTARGVEVCNGPAREAGVRRGQRRRDAQSRCPELVLLKDDPARDARAFEAVLATVEDLRPGVAPIRPGLLAVRAPGRYFGGEEHAAATLAEALVTLGVWDCRIGVADDPFTAEQAARRADVQGSVIVPSGGAAAYLGPLPVDVLAADGPEGIAAVSLLSRLGMRTLGDVGALPADAVSHRFGTYGATVWRRVRGEDPTLLAARTPPPELVAHIAFEPPLDSVEAVCFSVRTTAERFLADLAVRQLVATEVRVEAEQDGLVVSGRTWLHPRHFSAADLVDRVHWQLQSPASSALRSRQESGRVSAPIDLVRFVPLTVEPTAAHAEGLWGGGTDERVERGVARVQAMIGFDGVQRLVLQGGRGPAERQGSVAWGERPVNRPPLDRPWPGRVPGPPPVTVFAPALAAEVLDQGGRAVAVTERGAVTGVPHRFRQGGADWQPVQGWAGPWPVDDSWWAVEGSAGRSARFQVVGADGRAWLLICGASGWAVEAGYD